jgi:hypothetical protein
VDWNKDGKKDLIAGDTKGQVTLFLNSGTPGKPELAAGVPVESEGKPISGKQTLYKIEKNQIVMENGEPVVDKVIPGSNALAEIYSMIHVADWNGDGLDDLLVGHQVTILFYKNIGTAREPKLAAPVKIESPTGQWPSRPSPYVVDWDGDGVQDLLVGVDYGLPDVKAPFFFRNAGTNQEPKLEQGVPLKLEGEDFDKGYLLRLGMADWNNDGKLDLLVGNRCTVGPDQKITGNVWLFLRK